MYVQRRHCITMCMVTKKTTNKHNQTNISVNVAYSQKKDFLEMLIFSTSLIQFIVYLLRLILAVVKGKYIHFATHQRKII